jgi:hypothetical protein
VPEGWVPNLSAESLKLADSTSDVKYGWISQIQYKLSLTKLHRLRRMLEKIDSYCWQNYLDWPEIEDWSDDSHRIVLIGEASQPLIVSHFTIAPLCML